MNSDLLEAAKRAIEELYNDTSVSLEKAIENMEALQEQVRDNINQLHWDLEARGPHS